MGRPTRGVLKTMKPVLIVGGGPVGLTAALCLAAKDVPLILFEAEAA